MSVQLSSLRVSLEMDGSNYVQGAAAIAKANEQMAASGTLAGAQMAKQDVAAGNTSAALVRLSKSNVDGYGSAYQFSKGVASLQAQMESGKVTADRASITYTSLVNRFGTVADATAIAGKGGKDFAAVVDGVNQKVGLQAVALDKARGAVSPMTAALGGLQMQMVMMAAGAGPVGVFLSALGPWGVVAAVGVGLVSAAFEEAQRTAHLLAMESVSLEKFSETTGLSTDTLQALTQAAAKHGVSADEATNSIVRFTSSWAQARNGGGEFLTQLQKINPALADQIQRTKDSGVAFEILTKAIQQADAAGDVAQRNLLLRAAGGRGGVAALTGVSAAVGEAGGLGAMTQQAVDTGKAINEHLLKEVQVLQAELDETKKHADLLMGAIGAKPILEAQLGWAQMRSEIAGVLSDIETGSSKLSPWQAFLAKLTAYGVLGGGAGAVGYVPSPPVSQPNMGIPLPAYPPQTYGLEGPAQPKDMKAQLADLREQISLLGGAATETDKLRLRMLELRAAVDGNKTAENEIAAARGMSAAQLDAYISKLNLHNAAMGAAASTNDIVTAKMAALQKQQMLGAGLTGDEIANQKRVATENANGTAGILQQTEAQKIQAATMGLSAGAAAALSAQMHLLAQDARTGKVATDEDTAARRNAAQALGAAAQSAALLNIQYEIKRGNATMFLTSEDVQIANQLKGVYPDVATAMASVEAAGLRMNQAVSTTSQQISGGLATALTDATMGTKTAAQSFKDFSLIAIRAIEEMIIKLMIVGPLMRGLTGLFGGMSGGFGSFGSGPGAWGSAKGNVFDQGRVIHPYALGGIFSDIVTRPTLFAMANGAGLMGEAGPEAIMPLKRGSDGRLGVSGQGGGAAPNFNVQVINNAGADVAVGKPKSDGKGGFNLEVILRKIDDRNIANAKDRGHPHTRALANTFGINMANGIA